MVLRFRKVIHRFISLEFNNILKYEQNINLPDSIYWLDKNSKDKVVFELEVSGYFWINYEYWHRISSMFDLNYFITKEIITEWLEEKLMDDLKNRKGRLKFEMSDDGVNFAWETVTKLYRRNNPH
jgi:hypothetical protein